MIWRILPRSLHRPVAVVEGSLTKNLNKIGVRLWTVSSLDEYCEVGDSDPLDALAHLADGPTGSDERRRAIAPDARELRRAPSARSISSTSAATCVAASSSSHVHPSSVRPGSNTISIRADCANTTDGMSKTMTLPAGCCADDSSQTATARARTMDRSSRSKRSRTDAGPDATDKALMTDWRSADAPRRRSAPRPCALLATAGT